MRFVITGFAGAIKSLHPKLLPDTVGQDSRNQKPGRGDLRPWKQPLTVATVPAGRKSIYRMGRDAISDAQYWLSWTGIVHVARGFIASDTTERTYFTGDGAPKVTDNTIGLTTAPYPTTARTLGIPKPTNAPTLAETVAGTGTDETRFYVQTFVTDRGEESAPGPVSSITVKPGATVAISALGAAPVGNYGITLRRIYRTVVGSSNASDFFLLIEQASSLTTATDNNITPSATTLASNGPTGESGKAWDIPPANLKQLIPLWGGMMAGISGRSVRVCEAFRPHAWPVAYEILTADVTPVALAKWDRNLLILTNGAPYVATGSTPDGMARGDDPLPLRQSCVSERSPRTVADGVCWAAPDGLAYYGNRPYGIVTEGLLTREDWQALKPETIIGAEYEGLYIGMYEPTAGNLKAFMVNPANPTGIYFLDLGYSAVYVDELTDALYVLEGANVRKWDAGAAFMTATFKSRTFLAPRPVNMGYMQVTADAYPVTVTITATWIDSQGVTRTVTQARTVNGHDPVTLQSGFGATDWSVEVSTAGAVQGIVLATSIQELKQL